MMWPPCEDRKDPVDPCSRHALFSLSVASEGRWIHLCADHFFRWYRSPHRMGLEWIALGPDPVTHDVAI